MNKELEKKWREEFTVYWKSRHRDYDFHDSDGWVIYLAARRKAQEEIDIHAYLCMDERIILQKEIQKLKEENDELKMSWTVQRGMNNNLAVKCNYQHEEIQKRDKLLEEAMPYVRQDITLDKGFHYSLKKDERRQWLKKYEELNK